MRLSVTKVPGERYALTNLVYLSPVDAEQFVTPVKPLNPQSPYVKVNGLVYNYATLESIPVGSIGLALAQRTTINASYDEQVKVTLHKAKSNAFMVNVSIEVDFLQKNKQTDKVFQMKELAELIKETYGKQFLAVGQFVICKCRGYRLKLIIKSLETVDINLLHSETKEGANKSSRGILMSETLISFVKGADSAMRLGSEDYEVVGSGSQLFKKDFNFEEMGIGGLDKEFSEIFRRAFASRIFPQSLVKKLGIRHVKGILLYGPPGTGKTLMARQIGKMLNGKEPKIVNGPEILNKFVGQSEENIRKLFEDAEEEFRKRGDESDLHIIIFDEIDAICKSRGSGSAGGTGVGDSIVNQLLAKLDGVEELNNILVIGMTNRPDMMDDALLRPGRLEVKMEISLPDEQGRLQIFQIHTASMKKHKLLGGDVDLGNLAANTKNYSGAEIEGVSKSAASYAMNRHVDAKNPTKPVDPSKIKVMRDDFALALNEIKPAFGVSEDQFASCATNGIIHYGPRFARVQATGQRFIKQMLESSRTRILTVGICGAPGSGKTALAASLAISSGVPYVKLITPEALVGCNERVKVDKIAKVFEDAYKSKFSVIVVDDIERLLDYVGIGPRFSNVVLQALLVLFKKIPPKGRRLCILATTSALETLNQLEFAGVFHATIQMPSVRGGEEVQKVLKELGGFEDDELAQIAVAFNDMIPIKKLINIAEMAKQQAKEQGGATMRHFMQCMGDYGYNLASAGRP